MDYSYFLALVVLVIAIDLYVHWLLADREVKRIKAESKRFEGEWQAFLNELKRLLKRKWSSRMKMQPPTNHRSRSKSRAEKGFR